MLLEIKMPHSTFVWNIVKMTIMWSFKPSDHHTTMFLSVLRKISLHFSSVEDLARQIELDRNPTPNFTEKINFDLAEARSFADSYYSPFNTELAIGVINQHLLKY